MIFVTNYFNIFFYFNLYFGISDLIITLTVLEHSKFDYIVTLPVSFILSYVFILLLCPFFSTRRTTFNISSRADLVAIQSLSFCLGEHLSFISELQVHIVKDSWFAGVFCSFAFLWINLVLTVFACFSKFLWRNELLELLTLPFCWCDLLYIDVP